MTAEAGDTYFYTISMIDMANNVEGHVEEESLPIAAGLKKWHISNKREGGFQKNVVEKIEKYV